MFPHAQAGSPQLRSQLLDLWVAVTDAGGAVGFVPPADPAEIAPALDSALARVVDGRDELGVLAATGPRWGWGLCRSHSALRRHWRTVLRVMVEPELQGRAPAGSYWKGCTGSRARSVSSSCT